MRYYCHGNFTEHDPTLVYCAKCDAFVPVDHFYEKDVHRQSRHSDYERYEATLKAFKLKDGQCTRPPNAPNIFA
jgi:hypothetical protein